MARMYTEDKLNSMEKETLIQLLLAQQEQLANLDKNLQLVLEQLADLKRHRFGRSTERHETEHPVAVYAGKSSDTIVTGRMPPDNLLRGSLVSPYLEAAVLAV